MAAVGWVGPLGHHWLAGVEGRHEPSVIEVGGVKIGGGHFCVVAGPCSVESEEQINVTAKAVKDGGVSEEEALKFVTLNPAIQLGIDDLINSNI